MSAWEDASATGSARELPSRRRAVRPPPPPGFLSAQRNAPSSACPADSIINPEAPLALRLSGQLLLGLVRLYLRKLQFLEEDAGLALRGLARVGGLPALCFGCWCGFTG